MKLTIDFETRSAVDLRKCGVYKYAVDDTTDTLCLAMKIDDTEALAWDKEGMSELSVKDVNHYIKSADIIEAHNAQFEKVLWHVARRRYGFDLLPEERVHCSAALARYYSLPGGLDAVCKALRMDVAKDSDGYKLMLKMCKPDKKGGWYYSPELLQRLIVYCKQDTEVEYQMAKILGELPKDERLVYLKDQEINARGIPIDIKGVEHLKRTVNSYEQRLIMELRAVTKGGIETAKQNKRILNWLALEGIDLDNLRKETVTFTLDGLELPDTVTRVLEIRQSLAKTSVAKLDAMVRASNDDNRVRGTLLYHGGHTGRWAGRLVQTQNLPRDSYGEDEVNDILNMDQDSIEFFYGDPIDAASKCIRGMIMAPEEKAFATADYSSIEARVLAWLADEEDTLSGYHKGVDMYKRNAMAIYNVPYDKVTKAQRQIGKVAELALGYQGFTGAFQAMAVGYGVKISDEQAADIATKWRKSRPKIVQYWKGIESAAIKAVNTKTQVAYGRIKFGIRGRFLHCRLPSGRLLSFAYPSLDTATTKYGVTKTVIKYWGENDKGHWAHLATYGGKLTENVVQAISRDLLVHSIFELEREGYPVVMHVHDEVVCEIDGGKADLKKFESIVERLPAWAEGLPMKAEGWIGKRYRK